jgi:hypothetical protein
VAGYDLLNEPNLGTDPDNAGFSSATTSIEQ